MDRRPMHTNRRPLTPEEKRRMLSQLTPEQKRMILKKRRMRKLKKRLAILVPVAVLLIAVIVLLLTLPKDKDKINGELQNAVPAAHVQTEDAPGAAEIEDAGASEADADANLAESDDPAATASASIQPAAVSAAASGPFDFDTAYIRALEGESTGADIIYDYSHIDPAKLDRWTGAKEGYIPILKKAKTEENIIAVTVDDCFQGENFYRIVQCAIENNAKLTIFPLGKNLGREAADEALRLAYQNGMEIGNHTYNHVGMFHYDQKRMEAEIWQQREIVNKTIGVNYTQHFFRPRGGDERECQRLHGYLNQLDYSAVAMWNKDGSKTSMNKLFEELAPGNIYLFHTTDNDLDKLLEFIPGAIARGYRLVTMSEMFGLPQNKVSELNPVDTPQASESFRIIPVTLEETSYLRAAAVVQKRLIELGWMSGSATGVYGNQSFVAVGFFQMALGLEPNGIADPDLQRRMFADDAPRGSLEKIQEFCRQLGKQELTQLPGTENTEIPMND